MRITRVATLAWLGAVVFALPVRAEQVCSNGVVEYPESCDDGNSVGGDSCPADCGVAPETSTLAVAGNSAAEGAAGTFNTLAVEVTRTGSTNFGINFGMRTLGDSASAGSASGMVVMIWATFISGPLSPPSAAFSSAACRPRSSLTPR